MSNSDYLKYTNAAIGKNNQLDSVCDEIDVYQKQIKEIFDKIMNEFPNDKNFFLGVETIVNEINKEISKFNIAVYSMKTSSLCAAKMKDEYYIERNNN